MVNSSAEENATNNKGDHKNRKDYKKQARIVIKVTLVLLVVAITAIVSVQICLGKTSIGQLGSAIGGITAPIVGFGGAILVYLSFLIQHQANEDLSKRQDELETKYQQKENFAQLQKLMDTIVGNKGRYDKLFNKEKSGNRESLVSMPRVIRGIVQNDLLFGKESSYASRKEIKSVLSKLERSRLFMNQILTWLYLLDELDLSEESKQILISQFNDFEKEINLSEVIEDINSALAHITENREKYLDDNVYALMAKRVNAFYSILHTRLLIFEDRSVADYIDYLSDATN